MPIGLAVLSMISNYKTAVMNSIVTSFWQINDFM